LPRRPCQCHVRHSTRESARRLRHVRCTSTTRTFFRLQAHTCRRCTIRRICMCPVRAEPPYLCLAIHPRQTELSSCRSSSTEPPTYPNSLRFLAPQKCPVEVIKTQITFGVSRDGGAFEWASDGLRSVFCQPQRVFDLGMWRMLFDIMRLNACTVLSADNPDEGLSVLTRISMSPLSWLQAFPSEFHSSLTDTRYINNNKTNFNESPPSLIQASHKFTHFFEIEKDASSKAV
jgi:hypothetical protein